MRQCAKHSRLRVGVFGAPPKAQRRCRGCNGLERQIGEAALARVTLEKPALSGGCQISAVAQNHPQMCGGLPMSAESSRVICGPWRVFQNGGTVIAKRRMVDDARQIAAPRDEYLKNLSVQAAQALGGNDAYDRIACELVPEADRIRQHIQKAARAGLIHRGFLQTEHRLDKP